ncbi:phage tail fiber protein, partial [Xenorhabdus bovienii]
MANTITAADAIITLSVTNLYSSGVQLQGFAADNIYGTEALELAETVRGADGKLSAGFIYGNISQTLYIMPDSDSRDIFDTWATTSRASAAVFRCNATVILPALKRKYSCVNGVL